jgi:hypothetical protein
MSHHPARRARAIVAVASAAAFAGIAGGLAAHSTAASSPVPTPTQVTAPGDGPAATPATTPTTASPTDPVGPDGSSWSGTPAPSGSLTQPQGPTHARSRAS